MGDTPPPRRRDRYSSSLSPRERPERSRSRTPPRRGKSGPVNDGLDRSRSRTPPRRGSRREPDALNPGNNLYVTGLSTRVNEKDLQEHFSQEGKVLECRLVLDPRTRESRGFGFVTMEHLDDAERCIKYLNRSTLEGRMITVEKNIPDHLRSASTNITLPFSLFYSDIKDRKFQLIVGSLQSIGLCRRFQSSQFSAS
jgi:transformer-2 protein